MSVLVKDMEMPQGSCEWVDKDCHLHRCKLLNSDDDCKMQEGLCSTITWQEQFANCPLIEVPTPHGKLIDAHELYGAIVDKGQRNERGKYRIGEYWELTGREIREVINGQSPIIDAEGGVKHG